MLYIYIDMLFIFIYYAMQFSHKALEETLALIGSLHGWPGHGGRRHQRRSSRGERGMVSPDVNGHFWNLNWRYLPCIRPM